MCVQMEFIEKILFMIIEKCGIWRAHIYMAV